MRIKGRSRVKRRRRRGDAQKWQWLEFHDETHTQSNLCLKSLNSQLLLLHHLRQTFSSIADDNDDNISTEISQECQKRLKITQTAPAALQWEPGAATASETYRRGEQPRKNRGPKLQVSWPHGPTVVEESRVKGIRQRFFASVIRAASQISSLTSTPTQTLITLLLMRWRM